jgi:hypothetical protein
MLLLPFKRYIDRKRETSSEIIRRRREVRTEDIWGGVYLPFSDGRRWLASKAWETSCRVRPPSDVSCRKWTCLWFEGRYLRFRNSTSRFSMTSCGASSWRSSPLSWWPCWVATSSFVDAPCNVNSVHFFLPLSSHLFSPYFDW